MELQNSLTETLTKPLGDPLCDRVLDSKYTILARIGKGSIGTVYRAHRALIGDQVAVKVLHPRFISDPVMIERFRREARAAAQVNDSHIIKIYDYCETNNDGLIYFVMQYVPGSSLRLILKRDGPLPPARAVALILEICAGVGAAHQLGIVHRDLKPENIIHCRHWDDRENLTIIDFGVCKLLTLAAEQFLTQPGSLIGTPYYMSPEQCRGESVSASADVYSLGVMLYEMITGRPPFLAKSAVEVMMKHLKEEPAPLSTHLDVSPELSAVISRALAKDPQARQVDAIRLAEELNLSIPRSLTRQRKWLQQAMYQLGIYL